MSNIVNTNHLDPLIELKTASMEYMAQNLIPKNNEMVDYSEKKSDLSDDTLYKSYSVFRSNDGVESYSMSSTASQSDYLFELIKTIFSQNTISNVQARLTGIELLRHFSVLNEFIFILRVSVKSFNSHKDIQVARFCLSWLVVFWFSSILTYLIRKYIILHRVREQYNEIFQPIKVFRAIKKLGKVAPQELYEFDKLVWTFGVLMRIVQDAPQAFISAIFVIHYGKDIFAIMSLTASLLLLISSTLRMGISYPMTGTLSLLLSASPPMAENDRRFEAAPTSIHITAYMSFITTIWAIMNILTTSLASPPISACLYLAAGISGLLAVLFGSFWLYLYFQANLDIDNRFLSEYP